MEVEIFPVYTKAKGRGKRKKPTSEIQQRLNQRHTEGRLRGYSIPISLRPTFSPH